MADIETELKRLNTRQEAMVAAIHGLTDIMEQTRDQVSELMAWLQEPPANDLAGLMTELVTAVNEMRTAIAALPDQVAHALRTP